MRVDIEALRGQFVLLVVVVAVAAGLVVLGRRALLFFGGVDGDGLGWGFGLLVALLGGARGYSSVLYDLSLEEMG